MQTPPPNGPGTKPAVPVPAPAAVANPVAPEIPAAPAGPVRWVRWARTLAIYAALLLLPPLAADWLGEQVPQTLQPFGRTAIGLIAVPLIYGGLYIVLETFNARAQKFIWMVLAACVWMAWSALQRGLSGSDLTGLLGAVVYFLYAISIGWIVWKRKKLGGH